MSKIMVGLPAYNESQSIAKLMDRINLVRQDIKIDLEVFAVNDGSNDDTEQYLINYSQRFPHIKYVNHPCNQGLAQGMRTIIDYSINHQKSDDILVVLDADNTHNPNIIPAMVEKLISKKLDIVIASRFEKSGQEIGLSPYRKFLSRGASLFANIFFNVKGVKDYSCGFRAYNVDFLKKMKDYYGEKLIQAQGFECMIELIIKAGFLGAKIDEYPLILEYNLKETPSKMKVMKTIGGYFKLAFEYNKLRVKVKKR